LRSISFLDVAVRLRAGELVEDRIVVADHVDLVEHDDDRPADLLHPLEDPVEEVREAVAARALVPLRRDFLEKRAGHLIRGRQVRAVDEERVQFRVDVVAIAEILLKFG